MSGSRVLWGAIVSVAATVLLGVWAATQWTAAALAYQPELGAPLGQIFGWPIYPPYALFWWWFSFDVSIRRGPPCLGRY